MRIVTRSFLILKWVTWRALGFYRIGEESAPVVYGNREHFEEKSFYVRYPAREPGTWPEEEDGVPND